MKTISPAAMAAIEAGEAIVTGAVELIPLDTVHYTTVGVVNIDAVDNCAGSLADAMSVGITLTGFGASDTVRVTQPAGQMFTAWNFQVPVANRWLNEFDVVPDGVAADSFRVAGTGIIPSSGAHAPGFATAADARAAFGTKTFSGASDYTFWIMDTATGGGNGNFNNSEGVSVQVERGVAVGAAGPIRVWGGYGPIEIDGQQYLGIGDRGLAQQTSGAIGGVAQGLTLALSGIDAALLELFESDEVKGASAVVRRLIFASDGKTMLDASIWDRGRVDAVETEEVIGGAAAIKLSVESAARGLGKSGARQRSDSDQRLINPNDGYFKHAAYAAEKMLYWGGKRPHRIGSVQGIGG